MALSTQKLVPSGGCCSLRLLGVAISLCSPEPLELSFRDS